jgi:cytochrome c-type biogenesis protein CcmH/NrfF
LKTLRSSRPFLLLVLVLALVVSLEAIGTAEAYQIVCSSTVRSITKSASGFNCDLAIDRAEVAAEDGANTNCSPYEICAFSVTSVSCSNNYATVTAQYQCNVCQNGPCPF